MKLESKFQHELIKKLKDIFPGCEILKNDPSYKKAIPDLVIFYKDKYAFLEVKRSRKDYEESVHSDARMNQKYYIDKFNDWSFAKFVYPENEAEVLQELQEVFK